MNNKIKSIVIANPLRLLLMLDAKLTNYVS